MFEGIIERLKKLSEIDENQLMYNALQDAKLQAQIIDLNQKQLLMGKGMDGEDLPRYIDDPFFKTPKAAMAYQAWKSKISPNPEKNPEVMDFFINGQFHNTISIRNNNDNFEMISNSSIKNDVQNKTNNEVLGLTEESIEEITPAIVELMIEQVKELL